MSANPEYLLEKISKPDTATQPNLPNSKKIYVEGSRPDTTDPMTEVSLTPTQIEASKEDNSPL